VEKVKVETKSNKENDKPKKDEVKTKKPSKLVVAKETEDQKTTEPQVVSEKTNKKKTQLKEKVNEIEKTTEIPKKKETKAVSKTIKKKMQAQESLNEIEKDTKVEIVVEAVDKQPKKIKNADVKKDESPVVSNKKQEKAKK